MVKSNFGIKYILLTFLFITFLLPFAHSADTFSLLSAGEKGVFNVGDAQGNLSDFRDADRGREVLKLDYTAKPSTAVGVWTKTYPEGFSEKSVDAAKIGIKVSEGKPEGIAVSIEVKGDDAIQGFPVKLGDGWTSVEELIDWVKIGNLTEIVIVVNHAGGSGPVAGTLLMDFDFYKIPAWQKISSLVTARAGGSFIGGLICAIAALLLGGLYKKEASEQKGIMRDLTFGVSAVLVAVIVVWIHKLGSLSFSEVGWSCLAIGLLGLITGKLLKLGLTGKPLTPGEAFRDFFFTSLLAASAGSIKLLQAPGAWQEILVLNAGTAAMIAFFYHVVNANKLASSGKHMGSIGGTLIVATPYLMGMLLFLQSANLMYGLGNAITFDKLLTHPRMLQAGGRTLVVFLFNSAIANALSLGTRQKIVKDIKAYLFFGLVAACVVGATLVADFGSSAFVAKQIPVVGFVITILTTILALSALWAEAYLLTGLLMDAIHGFAPTAKSSYKHAVTGLKKGMVYSGVFITLIHGVALLLKLEAVQSLLDNQLILMLTAIGALAYPLFKTIIETFDGSTAFFGRAKVSYRNPVFYLRGAIMGLGLALAISCKISGMVTPDRVLFGLVVGVVASTGVSIVRDVVNGFRGKGRIQSWRPYFISGILGGFVGAALAFYFDEAQIAVVVERVTEYATIFGERKSSGITLLVMRWGDISIGSYTGGVRLFFNQALMGVLEWSVAAWLFAINRAFLTALFQKDKAPIKDLFSRKGFATMIQHMIEVMRWGLWMAPIIKTFLRQVGDPTWYNQDGAIRTAFATFNSVAMSDGEFHAWSLKVFMWVLAYDAFRVLIWIDHMGLRVATLVNLSFIGMDRLDEKFARFIGRGATIRCIPEGIKRFMTWAPLLIPYYIPATGADWDSVWNKSQEIINAAGGPGLVAFVKGLSMPGQILFFGGVVLVCTIIASIIRQIGVLRDKKRKHVYRVSNNVYEVVVQESGEAGSHVIQNGHDISRRSYDAIDPAGRSLYIVDSSKEAGDAARSWPVMGNYPQQRFKKSDVEKSESGLKLVNSSNDIKTTVDISLPDSNSAAEIWTVTLENLSGQKRDVNVVPYLEWNLDKPSADRGHTQYNRLFPVMEYAAGLNAILTWQKHSKVMGFIATDKTAKGFLSSRMEFVGRAQSMWKPRVLDTMAFLEPKNTSPYPTFDPIGSLLSGLTLDAKGTASVRFMIGETEDRETAVALIKEHLNPQGGEETEPVLTPRKPLIGHGEILPGTPQPYYTFADNGDKLIVHTPYTTRPYDHALSNAVGHYMTVTNRGLHTSSNANSQQNRLTPDWADTVTREWPSEAIYLYDVDSDDWYSPTYHPLNDADAKHESEFGVDGTAIFRMEKEEISTELTVFIPPAERTGVYLLKIKNSGSTVRKMRVAPYFQMVLSDQVEHAGPLDVKYDNDLDALLFKNPRNNFCMGPAFASMSIASDKVETNRGKFFGTGRGVDSPYMVEKGEADATKTDDERPIAGLLGTVEVPANGEVSVTIVLGQTDTRKDSAELVKKYKSTDSALASLEETRKCWMNVMSTLKVETSNPDFDQLQNWLKYQALAERIWARRGFYQTSGAFGFRDQLQDTVNLIWMDPSLARKQIVLHASQQFPEGDVVHWFHSTADGRTGFANRSYASDNLLWLVWGTAEYVRMTGDKTVLDEMTPYLKAEQPLMPLPAGKHGLATIYLRSTSEDSVYRHCMKSLDTVFEKRMGKHGIPLILTGDWNDGLDEIGSEGKGESVWLGLFLYYILNNFLGVIEAKDGKERRDYYAGKMAELKESVEKTWKGDRYLRAIHDDGTEIGVKDSGVWEIDALTAAWAVTSGINPERGRIVFDTAISVLERDNVILLGCPPLRDDTKPYLGRSSQYPEGVRENGMYCHGDQWLIRAARVLAEQFEAKGDAEQAAKYRETAYRLWLKITPVFHMAPEEIEIYGGQPNKQAADMLTTFDVGRMIWNGYTGASGWLLRQSFEGVVGATLKDNEVVMPNDLDKPRGDLNVKGIKRTLKTN